MNYIKKLQLENEDLRHRDQAMNDLLQDLIEYCQSNKFQGVENQWMNPDDIVRRIQEGKSNIDNFDNKLKEEKP